MTVTALPPLPDGRDLHAISLQADGLAARVLTLGAIVQDLRFEGVDHPLVLGSPDPAAYMTTTRSMGAIVGRCANRINGASFTLDGTTYHTDKNCLGRHTLHGGVEGVGQQVWQIEDHAPDRVTLSHVSPDGHMGFPGRLTIRATISLQDQALVTEMEAVTDAPTPCNLAPHGYFNLDGSDDVLDHHLMIAADRYLPLNDDLLPLPGTGLVEGTLFDFREDREIGRSGYDHNFCLADSVLPPRPVARLTGRSGLAMTVETNMPGLQIYDGRHFAGLPGLDGRVYGPHAGLAMETQFWPDSPNRPDFPDVILRPGQTYRHHAAYRFARA